MNNDLIKSRLQALVSSFTADRDSAVAKINELLISDTLEMEQLEDALEKSAKATLFLNESINICNRMFLIESAMNKEYKNIVEQETKEEEFFGFGKEPISKEEYISMFGKAPLNKGKFKFLVGEYIKILACRHAEMIGKICEVLIVFYYGPDDFMLHLDTHDGKRPVVLGLNEGDFEIVDKPKEKEIIVPEPEKE